MVTKDDGGPVHPTSPQHYGYPAECVGPGYPVSTGMSLRDWFAAMAMMGDWASQSDATGEYLFNMAAVHLENAARKFYRMADAMLKVRQEQCTDHSSGG